MGENFPRFSLNQRYESGCQFLFAGDEDKLSCLRTLSESRN